MFIIITIFIVLPLSECSRDPTENLTRQERIDFFKDVVSRQGNLTADLTKVELWEASRREKLPKSFDARKAWPECKEIIGEVSTQGKCGGCWAYSAASLITMRTCIETRGRTQIRHSYQDIVECAEDRGCHGGPPDSGFEFFVNSGVVSGGYWGTKTGCKPANNEIILYDEKKKEVSCKKKCSNKDYHVQYKDDKKFGYKYYSPGIGAEKMQNEIITNGPVSVAFGVPEDFVDPEWTYIYNNTRPKIIGRHSAIVIGWGEENKVPYWLVVSSWGTNWGDKGFFRILRGVNICGIEKEVFGIRVFKPEKKKDVISPSISFTIWKVLLLSGNLWSVIRCIFY